MSLYADLDVPPDADMETIKRAHRRAVKRYHPDNGGDRTKFEKAQCAWEILSDPDKRKQYDLTGSIDDQPNNPLAELTALILPAFDAAMNEAGEDLSRIDVMEKTKERLRATIVDTTTRIGTARSERRRLEGALHRVKFNGSGPDMIANVLRERIAQSDRNIEQAEEQIRKIGRAIAHLDQYGWDYEMAEPNVNMLLRNAVGSFSLGERRLR